MPLIIDDEDQLMDDLFGDEDVPAPDGTPVSVPIAPGLAQRSDDLTFTNCSQQIAWSRFGVLAVVDQAGTGVNLFTVIRDVKTGVWNFSPPHPLLIMDAVFLQHHICHLQWSDMGNALSIVNTVGRVCVYAQAYHPLGEMLTPVIQVGERIESDESNPVVGMYWMPLFPQQKQSGAYWAARWDGENFAYESSSQTASGAHNPVEGKSAIIYLRRDGTLRLVHEKTNNIWADAYATIEEPTVLVDPAITHACFAQGTGNASLILATYDTAHRLRVYNINIRWMPNALDGQNVKETIRATMVVESLLIYNLCIPTLLVNTDRDGHNPEQFSTWSLKQLITVPAASEDRTHSPSFLTIVATFASEQPLPTTTMGLDSLARSSIICRWQVRDGQQSSLSPCFDSLSVKKKPASTTSVRTFTRLERLPDVQIHCPIVSIQHLKKGTQIALILSDGSIQFRDRESLDLISFDNTILDVDVTRNLPEIKSMPQIGFAFPVLGDCSQTAFSPDHCLIAIRGSKGEVDYSRIEYTLGAMKDLRAGDPKLDSIAAVLALQHSCAMVQYKVTDDILAFLTRNASDDLKTEIVDQCRRAFRVHFDLITDEDGKNTSAIHRGPYLYKCLSLQNVFSTNSKGVRQLKAKLAWITLNLRFSFFMLGNSLNKSEPLKPEMALSLVGQLHYCLDLIVYLIQELMELSFLISDHEDDIPYIQNIVSRQNSPAFHIIVSSFSRSLLRLLARPMRNGYTQSQAGKNNASISTAHRACYAKLFNVYRNAPLNIGAFETFLSEVDQSIKQAYTDAGLETREKTAAENAIVLNATIHSCLAPAIKKIMTTDLSALLNACEPVTIHNYDIAWLGLTEDPRSLQIQSRITYDVVRKTPLMPGSKATYLTGNEDASSMMMKMKRCTRCGSVVEDIQPDAIKMQIVPAWIWQGMKNCVCYSSWAAMPASADEVGLTR